MNMTEEDTFNRLRRTPFNNLLSDGVHSHDLYEYLEIHGWTVTEYADAYYTSLLRLPRVGGGIHYVYSREEFINLMVTQNVKQ